jgi:hypothetical protein
MYWRNFKPDPIGPVIAGVRAKAAKSWRDSMKLKVLLVTGTDRIEQSQIYPFYFYLKQLKQKFAIDIREMSVSALRKNQKPIPKGADIVFFQPWFTIGIEEIVRLINLLKDSNPYARFVFMDSYAPSDLRFAEAVEPLIDYYVKKHVLHDRSDYGKETQGDTKLVDFYEKLYHLPPSSPVTFKVSTAFLSKLVVGPSFFTSHKMLPQFHSQKVPGNFKKRIRVHARLGSKGTSWYQAMREHALDACKPFSSGSIISSDLIGFREYISELSQAKICFSPFGYGEVCWRDYEAVMLGALLVKPDMSHIETIPDVFIPDQTYVPVKWDYSDLDEKIDYYLSHENELNEIVQNAYRLIHEYCMRGSFIEQFSPILTK